MKKIVLVLMIVLSSIIFSKDNYILSESRIKEVFCDWEIMKIEKKEALYIDILDRNTETRIQMSNYSKSDSISKARERFKTIVENDGFNLLKNTNNKLSNKYFNRDSIFYFKKVGVGNTTIVHIFLDNIKISVEYINGDVNYENALKRIKEAIDPTEQIKSRTKKIFNKNYSIDNYIIKNKLITNAKSNFKNVSFHEIAGNEYDFSEYQIATDANQLGTRAVTVRANNNYSRNVLLNRWEHLRKQYQDPYQFRDEEKKITQKYFGVNAKTYTNDYLKRESKLPIIGVIRYIMTDNFTIVILTYELKGNKNQELKEYEAFLKLVKDSMK